MTKRIGIDADQKVGREKSIQNGKVVKAPWMAARITLLIPRTLAKDFREECSRRKLTHIGVARDLMICWLIANKEGINADDYRRLLQDELKAMDIGAKEAQKTREAKLSGNEKRIAMQAKARAISNPIHQDDLSLHKENPFEGSGWLFKDDPTEGV